MRGVDVPERRTARVLLDVAGERRRQRARYGAAQDIPDGTGPSARWLWGTGPNVDLDTAHTIEARLRKDYESADAAGQLTWMHLVREEIAEAFQESTPERLREELLQVAALCVSWVEALDARSPKEES